MQKKVFKYDIETRYSGEYTEKWKPLPSVRMAVFHVIGFNNEWFFKLSDPMEKVAELHCKINFDSVEYISQWPCLYLR